jgi:ABC-2 type transport system ATP-binding protein
LTPAIALSGVTKTFGTTTAVRDLELLVPTGALYGFIGPNGAGKTTSLRMIMSILFPDCGEISVLGCASALAAKDRIGYLPEERGVYRKMKVGAFLTYMARLKGVSDADAEGRVRSWLDRVELKSVYDKKCEELSKGMQQKVQLIAAVLHQPDLLILDEPFSGLDPVNMRLLRDVIVAEHRRGATILFSTHIMIQAEEICEHIVMLHRGRKVLDESLSSIRRRHNPRAIRFEPFEAGADVTPLRQVPGVMGVQVDGSSYRVELAPGTDPVAMMLALATAVPPSRVELQRPSLEDVFVGLVAGDVERAGAPA